MTLATRSILPVLATFDMRQKLIFIFLFCLFPAMHLLAQDRLISNGQSAIERGNYAKANTYFETAFRRSPSYAAAVGNATAYLARRDYRRSADWHAKALSFAEATLETRFRYARLLQMLKAQVAASQQFDTCALRAPQQASFLAMAQFAHEIPTATADTAWQIQRLRINAAASDFGPTPWKNGLIFGSQRNNSVIGVTHLTAGDGGFLADLYFAKAKDSTRFGRPDLLPRGLNTVFHEGPCYPLNDSTLIFVRSQRVPSNRQAAPSSSDFWQSTYENGKWQTPQQLPFTGPRGTYTDPFVLPGGTTLLFAAEIPGGQGGLDLYQSQFRDGNWTPPQNLGPAVNTPGNERSPVIGPAGKLWFASDGHPGFGGLDLFSARRNGPNWTTPQNAGRPLNSHLDDYDLVWGTEGSFGYFVSNRKNGNWDDDIYVFSFAASRKLICQTQQKNSYCYQLYEDNTPDPLPPTLYYQWDLGDGSQHRGGRVDHCFPGPGDYTIRLEVIDSLTGAPVFRQTEYTLEIRDEIQAHISGADSLQKGQPHTLSAKNSYFPGFRAEKYEWSLGDGNTAEGETVVHTYPHSGLYEVQLTIWGRDSLAPERDHYCTTRPIIVVDDFPKVPPIASLPPETLPPRDTAWTDVPKKLQTRFRVQVGTQSTQAQDTPPPFSRIPGVTKVRDGDQYRYLLPGDYTLEGAFSQLRTTAQPKFSDVAILAFRDGKLLPYQPFLEQWQPADSLRETIVTGVVTDRFKMPKKVDILWENLLTGEVEIETQTDPQDGSFIERLPKEIFYGYYIDLEGYYSVSRHLDLRNTNGALVRVDSITLYAIRDLVQNKLPVRINNLFFDFDSAQIRKESYRELFRLVRFLLEHPGMKIEIAGHTDAIGTPAYNQNLSEQRAAAIARFLVLAGCDPTGISHSGYGETRPIQPGLSPAARKMNRRVEFIILSDN